LQRLAFDGCGKRLKTGQFVRAINAALADANAAFVDTSEPGV
jgi:hypothetical protein